MIEVLPHVHIMLFGLTKVNRMYVNTSLYRNNKEEQRYKKGKITEIDEISRRNER